MFCAPKAETVDSMEEGTKNRKLMIFSTMPTAAASFSPRRLAMMVMMIKEIWINPSCKAMGTPIFSSLPVALFCGLKSVLESPRSFLRFMITDKDTTTLMA